MNIDLETYMRMLVLKAPILIMALSIHEFWHAYTAYLCGDNTAKDEGRVTLNPGSHLDPLGTLFMLMPYSFIGWARPVPYNPANLGHPKRDQILIAVAGPASNLALAILFAVGIRALAFADALPMSYTFEPLGADAKGRATVEVRIFSPDGDFTKVYTAGDFLPDQRRFVEVADRDGAPVLVVERFLPQGGKSVEEVAQRSETAQRLILTVWKLLALAVFINFGLLLFNLVPIFPLDGHHVVRELLPRRQSQAYMEWMVQYGPFLLLGLLLLPRMLQLPFDPLGSYMLTALFYLTRFFVGDELMGWVVVSLQP